ncbi:hypothetical protein CON71_34565 [Bacillus thuringiensis]|uniref:Uncharacterized protein n=1 Tax=Bacillus thuringiensis TaxID=1428 RepID=A0A9X6Y6Y0_BACTU|nr:hypothetical protein CON71_34565 [Bacillus thuringiensis]
MTFPSFSPPFYKFRNICQNTIKYTDFNYSKMKNVERCPFKRNFQNMKHVINPMIIRDRRIYGKKFVLRIW